MEIRRLGEENGEIDRNPERNRRGAWVSEGVERGGEEEGWRNRGRG